MPQMFPISMLFLMLMLMLMFLLSMMRMYWSCIEAPSREKSLYKTKTSQFVNQNW